MKEEPEQTPLPNIEETDPKVELEDGEEEEEEEELEIVFGSGPPTEPVK